MQYSQEHLKTMVYAEFGGHTECIMGNWKIENETNDSNSIRNKVKNPNWSEANQLAINKRGGGFELGATENNSS